MNEFTFIWKGDECLEAIKDKVAFNMSTVVSIIDADMKQSMIDTPRGPNGRSFPGNPPAVQTTVLIGSIHSGVEVTEDAVVGTVGSYDVVYALRMELGFSGQDSLGRNYDQAPRPFLVPAFERIREDIPEMLSE